MFHSGPAAWDGGVSGWPLPEKTSIPWSQISVKAGADYEGDGLAVSLTAGRARLRLQRLEGEATREGLWLTSIVIPPSGTVRDRFRVLAADVRRLTSTRKLKAETVNEFQSLLTSAVTWDGSSWSALGSGMGGFPGRITGRHCDHRDPGGDALAGLRQSQGQGTRHLLPKQPSPASALLASICGRQ